jgi:hypothetical protein
MNTNAPDDLTEKRICFNCVGETYLKKEIKTEGIEAKCSYCGKYAPSHSLGILADRIDAVFSNFYERTSPDPDSIEEMQIREFAVEWERHGTPVVDAIEEAADFQYYKIAEEIQSILEEKYSDFESDKIGLETEYAGESYYELIAPDVKYWQDLWAQFVDAVKFRGRMFNEEASDILNMIFADLELLKTGHRPRLIVEMGPGTEYKGLYRARVFINDKVLKLGLANPDKELGPPPGELASAGRMNSRGISVFYGADSPFVALSEVRPPVGSKVGIAVFNFVRSVKVLNLDALINVRSTGSIFDPGESKSRQRLAFLTSLTGLMTMPVMPGEKEMNYIPTQAVADFLAGHTNPNLDGVQFSSVQSGGKGKNVVLFNKSSLVKPIVTVPHAEIGVTLRYDNGEYSDDYARCETFTPSSKKSDPGGNPCALFEPGGKAPKVSENLFTLEIDVSSITVHEVRAAHFESDAFPVRWDKFERRDEEDWKVDW